MCARKVVFVSRMQFSLFLMLELLELVDSFLLSGEFCAAFIGEDNTLQHSSGLMSYNPANDTYAQFYGGGVYSSKDGLLFYLISTPLYISLPFQKRNLNHNQTNDYTAVFMHLVHFHM